MKSHFTEIPGLRDVYLNWDVLAKNNVLSRLICYLSQWYQPQSLFWVSWAPLVTSELIILLKKLNLSFRPITALSPQEKTALKEKAQLEGEDYVSGQQRLSSPSNLRSTRSGLWPVETKPRTHTGRSPPQILTHVCWGSSYPGQLHQDSTPLPP